jgi:hypothetical protein
MVQALASEGQRLHRVVSETLKDRGPCEIPVERGSLRLSRGEGEEVKIEAISVSGSSLFSFTLTKNSCVLGSEIQPERFRERFGSELDVVRGMRERLGCSVPLGERIKVDMNKERMPKTPLEGDPPKAGTVERLRFDYIKELDRALTDPHGNKMQERGFVVGDRVFDISRGKQDPFTFQFEVRSRDGVHDGEVWSGARVVASLDGISNHNPDDNASVGSERNAMERLSNWMSRVGLGTVR